MSIRIPSRSDLFHPLLAAALMLTVWTAIVGLLWLWHFWIPDAKKSPRWTTQNPSHVQGPPLPFSEREGLGNIVSACDRVGTPGTQQLSAVAEEMFAAAPVSTPPVRRRRRASLTATSSLSPKISELVDAEDTSDQTDGGSAQPTSRPRAATTQRSLAQGIAPVLDMNHVYLSFSDFFWATSVLGLSVVFLWVRGLLTFVTRRTLRDCGLWKQPPCDYPAVVGQMMLETMLVVSFTTFRPDPDQSGERIASFVITDFKLLAESGGLETAELLTIDVSLKTKRMVHAELDGQEVTGSNVLTMIWFYTSSQAHVAVHAYANWGVNVEDDVDPFVRRMSIITVVYNHQGFGLFREMAWIFYPLGLVNHFFRDSIQEVFRHGLKSKVRAHRNLTQLAPHSRLVRFVLKLRPIFMTEFIKEKETLFPGINGEALFIGTVIHSLDHASLERVMTDVLWLDTTHPRFGETARLGTVVRFGFLEELSFLPIKVKPRDAKQGGFFRRIYDAATLIDPKLADELDACIVR